MSSYDFEVTIKRIINKTPMGTKLVFNKKDDLETIFQPNIVAMILKEWARTLEEKQAIIPCPQEEYRRKNDIQV